MSMVAIAMHTGAGVYDGQQEFYYLLKELYTVAGLADANGNAVELYDYDAYGAVRVYAVLAGDADLDVDDDGDVDLVDFIVLQTCYSGPGGGAAGDCGEFDADGDADVDLTDLLAFIGCYAGPDAPTLCAAVVPAPASDANPYFFTGRRLDGFVIGSHPRQLYHYRRRAYDPTHGRFLQQDPAEYVDGMNLYEYARSQPLLRIDPDGSISLAEKFIATLVWRTSLLRAGPLGMANRFWDWVYGETYEYQDDEDEIRHDETVSLQINDFYYQYLRQRKLQEWMWVKVEIPSQSATPIVGQFAMTGINDVRDAAWWLHGAHDVKVHGTVEVCKNRARYELRNLDTQWEWHDRIDANSYLELLRNGEDLLQVFVEGTWDVIVDGIMDADYQVVVHFSDKIDAASYPPGPKR